MAVDEQFTPTPEAQPQAAITAQEQTPVAPAAAPAPQPGVDASMFTGQQPSPESVAAAATPKQTHINVLDPEGALVSIPHDQLPDALQQGFTQATPEQVDHHFNEEKYGSGGQQAITALEGAAEAVTFGGSAAAERALGVPAEDIRGRREANTKSHMAGQVAGLVGSSFIPGVGAANILEKAGVGALSLGKMAGLAGEVGAGKISGAFIKAAAENALFQAGDEVAQMVTKDPNTSVEVASVAQNIGMSALLGGAIGGGIKAVSPLWNATVGNRVGSLLADFKGRMNYHLNNADPVATVTSELSCHYTAMKDMADEVYGAQGLKAQDIAKSMPEMSPAIRDHSEAISDKLRATVSDMEKKPNSFPARFVDKIKSDLETFENSIGTVKDPITGQVTKAATPGDIFNATQELKQTLQAYSKFDKFVKPVDEGYDFVNKIKGVAHEVRTSLENTSVWGKAAERQVAINKAFVDYLPALKDFEKKFTTLVEGDNKIDPAKINTYMNQLGKPNAEIKQTMLKNFLDASDKYRSVINDTHINLGLEQPLEASSLSAVHGTLEKLTPGAKLADALVKKGAAQISGDVIGAGIGGAIGHQVGAGGFGAIVGQHALGSFVSSILPILAKPILAAADSAQGFKAAVDYISTVAKGESLIAKASKNVFVAGREVLPQALMPNQQSRDRLDKSLKSMQTDPNALFNTGGATGHYLPEHGTAIAKTAAAGAQYLNSLRPNTDPKSPLDTRTPASTTQKADYNRALDVAQQPLILLHKIQEGTITPKDVVALKTMYPSLHAKLVQSLTDQIATQVSKGEMIPYKTRIGLSLFMSQAMDSTLTPSSIQAAQPQTSQQNSPAQAQGPAHGSTKSLSKLPAAYQTSTQQAEQARSGRK